jgi:hypothetical protein
MYLPRLGNDSAFKSAPAGVGCSLGSSNRKPISMPLSNAIVLAAPMRSLFAFVQCPKSGLQFQCDIRGFRASAN